MRCKEMATTHTGSPVLVHLHSHGDWTIWSTRHIHLKARHVAVRVTYVQNYTLQAYR